MGVLIGKWSDSYEDGTPPTHWVGSVAILQECYRTKMPVKYGQCWVFSGVMTTGLSTLKQIHFSGYHHQSWICSKTSFNWTVFSTLIYPLHRLPCWFHLHRLTHADQQDLRYPIRIFNVMVSLCILHSVLLTTLGCLPLGVISHSRVKIVPKPWLGLHPLGGHLFLIKLIPET